MMSRSRGVRAKVRVVRSSLVARGQSDRCQTEPTGRPEPQVHSVTTVPVDGEDVSQLLAEGDFDLSGSFPGDAVVCPQLL